MDEYFQTLLDKCAVNKLATPELDWRFVPLTNRYELIQLMMVHKHTMDYLCYPAPNGPSIGRIVVESAVDGPKSICGPFEKFHSMLISAIHGKLQTHNIPPRRHSPSTTNFSSSMSKHSQMGRCRGETLMICTCSQADRQTDSAMTNRSSSPRKDANVLMRIHDRTHDKPIGKRNLRRQSRLFNDMMIMAWPGLSSQIEHRRQLSHSISLDCMFYLHLPIGTMLFDWSGSAVSSQ